MDIETAFTVDAIDAANTNVDGDDENELRDVIRRIYETNQFDKPNEPEENIAVLCFVAGRAYQATNQRLTVEMSREMVGEFLDFLVERGPS